MGAAPSSSTSPIAPGAPDDRDTVDTDLSRPPAPPENSYRQLTRNARFVFFASSSRPVRPYRAG